MAYNAPRGDDVVLFVFPDTPPPSFDDIILHVNDLPLNHADPTAYLGAMWAESEAVQHQEIDCSVEFEALEIEAELTLPHAIGDARFKPMQVECEPHQVFLLDCDLILAPLRSETIQSYGSTAVGNAVIGALWGECDFCIDAMAIMSPLYAETNTSLTTTCACDGVLSALFAESSVAESISISADITLSALYAEATTSMTRGFSSYTDILEFEGRDTFVAPVAPADELTNILQFLR